MVQALTVNNLIRCYGDMMAVKGVDFAVDSGEIFGYLGPNGAGKTTTINMLTGLAAVTRGSISYFGKDYTSKIHKARPFIGIVPDESNLYNEMTGFNNLAFCGALYGMVKVEREKRAEELLSMFGLGDVGGKKFNTYSRGMKRRLTIAAALMHNPRLLFLDEPTTRIDVGSARDVRTLIQNLNAMGTTIFLTTHYIEEAERLCNRLAFIVDGRIVAKGTKETLMENISGEQVMEVKLNKHPEALGVEIKNGFASINKAYYKDGKLIIHIAKGMDLLPFFSLLREKGLKMYGVEIKKLTLEDVFVQLTGLNKREMGKGNGGGNK